MDTLYVPLGQTTPENLSIFFYCEKFSTGMSRKLITGGFIENGVSQKKMVNIKNALLGGEKLLLILLNFIGHW
jgi:hypothetical protein